MRLSSLCVVLTAAFATSFASADECVPEPGGKCLTKEQLEQVRVALQELDSIHRSKAELELLDPVIVVHDWDGRVYVNGGETKPLRVKLRVGQTVERDLSMVVKADVHYRERPPDPMFRLRIRAQAGLLVPQLVYAVKGMKENFFDAWASFDFMHIGPVNASANLGVFSMSIGPGVDLTRNFGVAAGYAMMYNGLRSSIFTGLYFSFN